MKQRKNINLDTKEMTTKLDHKKGFYRKLRTRLEKTGRGVHKKKNQAQQGQRAQWYFSFLDLEILSA